MDFWMQVQSIVGDWLSGPSPSASQEAWDELEAFLSRQTAPEPDQGAREYGDRGANRANRARGQDDRRQPRPDADALKRRQACADLEVPENAGIEEIRAAYRKQLKLYHPDRYTGQTEKQQAAAEVTRRLTRAYQYLISRPV